MGYWGIHSGAIGSAELADGSILAIDLCDRAVTSAKIALCAVEAGHICDGSVTTEKINDLAVTGCKIAAKTITAAQIADATITGGKLADATVTGAKIAELSITTAHIASVPGLAIVAGTVTAAKLDAADDYAWGGIHSFGSCGKLVLPTVGGTATGGLRFCTCSNVVQAYYSAAWHNVGGGDYSRGEWFYLPTVACSCGFNGQMCWNTAYYRPAFQCSSCWYPLAIMDDVSAAYSLACDAYSNAGYACCAAGDAYSAACSAYSMADSACSAIGGMQSCIATLWSAVFP